MCVVCECGIVLGVNDVLVLAQVCVLCFIRLCLCVVSRASV